MLESAKGFVKIFPHDGEGAVPDEIKVHSGSGVKIVPEENKTHSGDVTRCRIVPGDVPDMEQELGYTGISLDSGEGIKIVPEHGSGR